MNANKLNHILGDHYLAFKLIVMMIKGIFMQKWR
jgi:hypothetical protein